MSKKSTHLVDATLLLEMFIERNPSTMMPAVLAHLRAAKAERDAEIAEYEKIVLTLSDQLDALTNDEEYDLVIELDTTPEPKSN